MSDLKKKFLPFSNPGSVAYLKPLGESSLADHKLPEEYLIHLKNKRHSKVFLFSVGEKSLQFYPIFRQLGFEPFTIEPPTFPSKLNYDKNESYLSYAKSLSNFLQQMNRKDIFIFYPEPLYEVLVYFLVSAYLLSDETILEEELIEYFFEEESDSKTIQKNFSDMKNFLYGEFYLTFLSTKNVPEVQLQIEKTLQIENDSPFYKKQESPIPIKVELVSTENNIPYELNLSSLSQKFTPEIEKTDELSFNLSSLTPKEFSPESEEADELLDNLMEMADSFETKIAEKDVLNLDEIEEDEIEPPPFLTLKQIPKTTPKETPPETKVTLKYVEWEDVFSMDLPEPELPMDSFLFEHNSKLNLEDPIFKEDFIPVSPVISSSNKEKKEIKKNFLGLPENW